MLVREGWVVNHKKVLRLWREEGLKVTAQAPEARRPPQGEQARRAERPNQVWAIDFQFDSTADGRMLKLANVADEFIGWPCPPGPRAPARPTS
jgi:transposase InsO family protein